MKKFTLDRIYTTFDYGMFSVIPFNRKAESRNDLVSSYKKCKWGFIHPAIAFYSKSITGKMELFLLDGNNRLATAKHMKVGFRFEYRGIINDNDEILSLLVEVNNVNKKWSDQEFLDAFCFFRKPAYVRLQELMDQYNTSINTTTNLGEGETARCTPYKFREGTYEFVQEKFLLRVLGYVNELRKVMIPPKPKMQVFNQRAIMGLAKLISCTDKYDNTRLIKKLTGETLPDYAESETFKGFFESIY